MKKAASEDVCNHCGSRNPTNRCGRCGLVKYCSATCQRANWPAHKPACLAPEQRTREAAQAAAPPRAPLAEEGDECAICLEQLSLTTAVTLPCGHVFHAACVEGLRSFGVKQFCPMCRTELPPGPEQLFEEGVRLYFTIQRRVKRGRASWGALTVGEQNQMDEVLDMWIQAANQGQAEAQFNLAIMYRNGAGVTQSDVEAARWYRKAAEQGYAQAQHNLGVMYELGRGIPQSDLEAARWYRKAAEQGDAQAQSNLGLMYDEGRGVPQSDLEAARWYRKSADQGHDKAQVNLGNIYYQAKGVAQSFAEAARWYRKAAEQGLPQAQYNLGVCLLYGQGVLQDMVASHCYLARAAAQDHKGAKEALSVHFSQGAPASKTAVCARCGAAATDLKACTRCRTVAYCGRECQAAHWKTSHKKDCRAACANA